MKGKRSWPTGPEGAPRAVLHVALILLAAALLDAATGGRLLDVLAPVLVGPPSGSNS